LILAIETSCDDTCAAVLDGARVLSNVISSQAAAHEGFGGVVPEVASRHHLELSVPVVEAALAEAGASLDDVEAVAVTAGPGLIGALLVGVSTAKAIASPRRLPLIPVDHLQGHVAANFLEPDPLEPPFLCLVASGGHTLLAAVRDHEGHEVLGQTLDDAAGAAFDKAARMLGLGYPGGPALEKLAADGDPEAFALPVAMSRDPGLDFSFSGLKTAVLRHVRNLEMGTPQDVSDSSGIGAGARIKPLTEDKIADIAASFQRVVVTALIERLFDAARRYQARSVGVAGGVSANSRLRADLKERGERREIPTFLPSLALSTDNAAMIAAAGLRRFREGHVASLDLNADAALTL
jgi:N6-L-threonylcarbamoyladenine synthase